MQTGIEVSSQIFFAVPLVRYTSNLATKSRDIPVFDRWCNQYNQAFSRSLACGGQFIVSIAFYSAWSFTAYLVILIAVDRL